MRRSYRTLAILRALVITVMVLLACLSAFAIWYDTSYRPHIVSYFGGYGPRFSDYVLPSNPGAIRFVHISRATITDEDDTVTVVYIFRRFYRFHCDTFYLHQRNRNVSENFVDRLGQSLLDRRTEFYSDMGWHNPNPIDPGQVFHCVHDNDSDCEGLLAP